VVGARTWATSVAAAHEWSKFLGKEAIEVRDSPGFATSRLGLAIGLEAIRMVEENVASVADIDRGMTLGYKLPVGPLELTDRVGLDVRLAMAEHLNETLGERFRPPELLRQMVADGQLGRKSGRGFYRWTAEGKKQVTS
jgi:3-hydroxybutyryl-CoA dehydrogenase